MRHWTFSLILTFGMISICGRVCSQTSNTTPWPPNPTPGVGIGTQLSSPNGPLNALHIHNDPTNDPTNDPHTQPAMIRLSEGTSTATNDFGLLGLMPTADTMFSSLSRGNDLILHDHQDGDIIITNFSPREVTHTVGGAIRFATTGDTLARPTIGPGHHDLLVYESPRRYRKYGYRRVYFDWIRNGFAVLLKHRSSDQVWEEVR